MKAQEEVREPLQIHVLRLRIVQLWDAEVNLNIRDERRQVCWSCGELEQHRAPPIIEFNNEGHRRKTGSQRREWKTRKDAEGRVLITLLHLMEKLNLCDLYENIFYVEV